MQRRHIDVTTTSLRRHVPAWNLAPYAPPHILNLAPPHILNRPTPMGLSNVRSLRLNAIKYV